MGYTCKEEEKAKPVVRTGNLLEDNFAAKQCKLAWFYVGQWIE